MCGYVLLLLIYVIGVRLAGILLAVHLAVAGMSLMVCYFVLSFFP